MIRGRPRRIALAERLADVSRELVSGVSAVIAEELLITQLRDDIGHVRVQSDCLPPFRSVIDASGKGLLELPPHERGFALL